MIWLIGCHGMLGSEVARQLKEKKIDFTGSGREVDFTDWSVIENFVSDKKIDCIINCAAYTAVDKAESEKEEAENLNVKGPENIAILAKKIGAVLIHISTDYVFDGKASSPLTEDMSLAPLGVYGKTKADGEDAVRRNTEKHYILRTSWLYGWEGKNFVYTMIKTMNSHNSVKVVNDQKGSPTFAGNLAKIILEIAENPSIPYGTYHCTDLGEITWWDFTNEIKSQAIKAGLLTNKNCIVNPCTTEEYPTPAKRPAYSVLNKDKIQKALGITLPDWKEGLKTFINSPFFDRERIKI